MDQLEPLSTNNSLVFSLITSLIITSILIIFFTSVFPYLTSCFHKLFSTSLFCSCEICQAYLTSSWSKDFNNLCDWYSDLLQKSPTKTIHIHVLRNTITANCENLEYILKTNFENYPKGKPFSSILGDFLGRGIFNVDGELWKFQKKMASLELNKNSIRSFAFEVVNNEIHHRLIPLLKNQNEVALDLQDVFKRFSFDSICRFSFGLDPMCLEKSLPMSDFALSFDLASKLSAERAMVVSPLIWKIKRFFNMGSEKELKKSINIINMLAKVVINQKRKMGFSNHQDLLSRFMSTTIHDDMFLRDIVISFLLAGRDTVASSLTSFFWLLAKNREVESEILSEAERVMGVGNNFGVTNFEQLSKLHYLQAAAYESMRLYPPIQFDSKFCLVDDVLPDGTRVKSGTRVTYHPYAMGRLEELWGEDCLEFKPQRWLKDGVFQPTNQFKYPIFQAGLRVCIGKEMALMELKSVAISLLRKFRIELEETSTTTTTLGCDNPRFSPGLTATFAFGLPVFVRERGTNCEA